MRLSSFSDSWNGSVFLTAVLVMFEVSDDRSSTQAGKRQQNSDGSDGLLEEAHQQVSLGNDGEDMTDLKGSPERVTKILQRGLLLVSMVSMVSIPCFVSHWLWMQHTV